jgi:hypothetical protein
MIHSFHDAAGSPGSGPEKYDPSPVYKIIHKMSFFLYLANPHFRRLLTVQMPTQKTIEYGISKCEC